MGVWEDNHPVKEKSVFNRIEDFLELVVLGVLVVFDWFMDWVRDVF